MSETTPIVPEPTATPEAVAIPLPVAPSVPVAPATPVAPPLPVAPPNLMSGAKTNTLAIVSLVASILGGLAIVGIITGHIAINQIKRTGENGRGLALAGLIVGYIGVAITVIFLVVWVAVFATAAANGTLVTSN